MRSQSDLDRMTSTPACPLVVRVTASFMNQFRDFGGLILGYTNMFIVKWFRSGDETNPVWVENSLLTDLDTVVSFCQEAHAQMRLKHPAMPPDGFIVADADGVELRRWFGTQSEADSAYYLDLPVFAASRG